MFQFKIESGSVPAGNYRAKFLGVEEQPANVAKNYAAGLRWKWEILDGPQAKQVASRITGKSPTPANGCGKVISGLLGQPLTPGLAVDLGGCVGKTYLIVVQASPSGTGTRVEVCMPS
jgi:hypothetical protein